MKTEKQLVKDLNCLQETFYWSAGSSNVDGITRDFIESSIIPSYEHMVNSASDVIGRSTSKKNQSSSICIYCES